ncbi:hypothetical protein JRO89_XS01G0082400 [Xanthoceras sorbifolium]|uniref:FAR1 domain-containing protein n=1 Tax=Xanthoceras sorbifolium TaxID=99658 RepID=A0ABQ8IJC6_9ROSI|nr:hypothetical protein JRO89_XS01G0082400 [Xanthoceras sorbifolium]
MKTSSLPMEGLRWAKVAITDIVAETTNHKQNLREPQSGAVSMFNDLTYMPQVNDDRKPNLLQEFMNLDDVHAFYNNYAKEAGFSVRLGSSKKSKDTNVIERKEYLCYKEGVSCILEKSDRKRRRSITRECCSAKLVVVRTKKGTYKVSQFIEGHTHPLATPRKVHLLRSHRKVSMAQKSLSQKLSAANIPTHQQISILEMEDGGIQNIGCTKTNIYNYERDLQNAMKGHDAELDHYVDFRNCIWESYTVDEFESKWLELIKNSGQVANERKVVIHSSRSTEISDIQDKSMLTCRTRLFQLASNVIENVVGSEEASKILEDDLNNVLSKVKSVVKSDSISERHSSTPQIYNKPLAVRAKGCGKRLKGGKEKAKGKTTDNNRRCNGCGKVGQSHDKRNCPMINNRGEDL